MSFIYTKSESSEPWKGFCAVTFLCFRFLRHSLRFGMVVLAVTRFFFLIVTPFGNVSRIGRLQWLVAGDVGVVAVAAVSP